MKNRTSKSTRKAPIINPHVFSLMSFPFPVFVTDKKGKVVPTISLPEFHQLTRYAE